MVWLLLLLVFAIALAPVLGLAAIGVRQARRARAVNDPMAAPFGEQPRHTLPTILDLNRRPRTGGPFRG